MFLYHQLKKVKNINPYPPTANFIFMDISSSNYNSDEITELLGQKGILIRNCKSYRGLDTDFIRLAVKSRKDNEILIDTLNALKKEEL